MIIDITPVSSLIFNDFLRIGSPLFCEIVVVTPLSIITIPSTSIKRRVFCYFAFIEYWID